ncbi:unnamed protein product [Oppiella nova]|uniref:peptide-methionine (S)-S-oxide reductase n=1 Tax=Oppiella nova TaxID=334625 RepID=A0A7R9QW98_9ACAR|nr:unnamed protein product [Oppiella nova]CAG2176663.1 unnamed protein product [Oppiella nova]
MFGFLRKTTICNREAQYGCAPGVIRTRVGYTGGTTPNPTYHKLGDHTETIDIQYDPNVTTYEKILGMFWDNHSPTQCHKRQYMSAIFYHNPHQKQLAEESMKEMQKKYAKPIQTLILPSEVFYEAEDYHQKFMLRKHQNLVNSLGLSDKQLIGSHIAGRLNGYLGHFGTFEAFNKEVDVWGITSHQKDYVLEQMKSSDYGHC